MKPFIATILVGLAILCYVNTLHSPFVWDDLAIVPQIQLHSFQEVLRWNEPRPLLMATYRLNEWFSADPFYFHLVDILLHALNVILVYLLCWQLSRGNGTVSFAGAALFAVHPLFSEAVVSIAARSSLLCGTFYFGALLCSMHALQSYRMIDVARGAKDKEIANKYVKWHTRRVLLFALATSVLAFCALETKVEVITLFPLIVALWWIHRGWSKEFGAMLLIGSVLLVSVASLERTSILDITQQVQKNSQLETAGLSDPIPPLKQFFPTYVVALVATYYGKMIVPHALSVDPFVPTIQWKSAAFVVASLIILGLIVVMLDWKIRAPVRSAIACLLVSPLSAYAFFPIADPVLEHRSYIAGLGLALLFGLLIDRLSVIHWEFTKVAAGATVLLFAFVTISHNEVWASPVALWEQAVLVSPMKSRPHMNLGQANEAVGNIQSAVKEYNAALAVKPDNYSAESNLGAIYLDVGAIGQASISLNKVVIEAPTFPEGWINHAVMNLRMGQLDMALSDIDQAIKLKPSSAQAWQNKSIILRRMGRIPEADAIAKEWK